MVSFDFLLCVAGFDIFWGGTNVFVAKPDFHTY